MNRFFRITVALILVLGCIPVGGFAASASGEPDADLAQAAALGIVDSQMLQNPNLLATRLQAAQMVAAVQRLRFGTEGQCLQSMIQSGNNQPATRYWFGSCLYYSWTELCAGIPYPSGGSWTEYLDVCGNIDHPLIDNMSSSNVGLRCANFIFDNAEVAGTWGGGDLFCMCTDVEDLVGGWPGDAPMGVEYPYDFGDWWVAMLCTKLYDRSTGEKVLDMNQSGQWLPQETMTVAQAAQAALRYYRSFEPEAVYVPIGDAGAFDPSILTPELLARETALPPASCAHIPAQWQGALFTKWASATNGALYGYTDKTIRAEDFDAMQAAGFNNAVCMISFSLLQGPDLHSGMVNVTRLQELDQVIAYAMKRDMHITIQCSQTTGFTQTDPFVNGAAKEPQTDAQIAEIAAFWGMLAGRYAEIPNETLAFDLFCEPEIFTEDRYAEVYTPSVEAIRAASPDRVIIADIHSGGLTGEAMAKLGVALSYHQYAPRSFCALEPWQYLDADYMASVQWPYTDTDGNVWDADTVAADWLDESAQVKTSYEQMKALAESYGVGFTVGEFGIFADICDYTTYQYPTETILGYVNDMLARFERDGVSFTYGVLLGSFAPVLLCQPYDDITYTDLGNSYYLFTDLCDIFQRYCAN